MPHHFPLPTVCGGHLIATNALSNIFSHAKYGDENYDNGEDCDWIIETEQLDDSQSVRLQFHSFELEDDHGQLLIITRTWLQK